MIVCRTDQGGLTNVLGALYATTLFFSIINATVIQPVIAAERAVSYRERAAGTYSVFPFTLALVSAPASQPCCCTLPLLKVCKCAVALTFACNSTFAIAYEVISPGSLLEAFVTVPVACADAPQPAQPWCTSTKIDQ